MKTTQQLIRYFLNGVVHEREARFIAKSLRQRAKVFGDGFENTDEHTMYRYRRHQKFWDESWRIIRQKKKEYEWNIRFRIVLMIFYVSVLLLLAGLLVWRQTA